MSGCCWLARVVAEVNWRAPWRAGVEAQSVPYMLRLVALYPRVEMLHALSCLFKKCRIHHLQAQKPESGLTCWLTGSQS
jgi:hypothetical protein